MLIFQMLNKLYTTDNLRWLEDVGNEFQPYIINKWLAMNEKNQKIVRYLDKYTFNLEPKHFIMLAWSVIPKSNKAPYIKYIKSKEEIKNEYNFLIKKIRNKLEISDNDWKYISKYYLDDIEKNKLLYFQSFGIEKKLWKKFDLDYKELKNINKKEIKTINKWF